MPATVEAATCTGDKNEDAAHGGLASAAAILLLVWPAYTGFDGAHTAHATLVQVNGLWAIAPVLFPVFIALLPLVFRKQAIRIIRQSSWVV